MPKADWTPDVATRRLEVVRGDDPGPAIERVAAAFTRMPPGTKFELVWEERVLLLTPAAPPKAMVVRVRKRPAPERVHS